MRIAIASDHGGFKLKEEVRKHLEQKGIEVLDLGCQSEDPVYYPEYGRACGQAVMNGSAERGIVICGTGIGISIAANRIKGIRCALCTDLYMAEMSRKFNDSNVLALGAKVLETELALQIADKWIATDFDGGRHQHSVDLLDSL